MKIIYIVVAVIALAAGLFYEESQMSQGNWREGTSFANLEIGDSLIVSDISLTFLGETEVNCNNFPPQAQEECKNSKFFTFKINSSNVLFKIYQGHKKALIVFEGAPWYDKNTATTTGTIMFSNNSHLSIDSPTRFYAIKCDDSFKNLTRFKIETIFKKS